MGKKIALLVIFGGISSEHEVSCSSAASILDRIDTKKYEIHKIGITKTGKWLLTKADTQFIASGAWEDAPDNMMAAVSPDRSVGGICTESGEVIRIDCVFPVLHGKYGEDGTLQGLLEIAGLPFVGSGTLASACCMDKVVTKILVEGLGVRQPKYFTAERDDFMKRPAETAADVEDAMGHEYPLFVKPANAGSSVGISKVNDIKELISGMREAAAEDHKMIVEETITGREMEVAVLGNKSPAASAIGEIMAANEFYDYDAKYTNEKSRTEIVADISSEKSLEMRTAAVDIYSTLGCRGMARVDFFLTEDKEVVFSEVNTIPGFTKISMYPKLWTAAGLEYGDLIDKLIDLAMEDN